MFWKQFNIKVMAEVMHRPFEIERANIPNRLKNRWFTTVPVYNLLQTLIIGSALNQDTPCYRQDNPQFFR